MKRKALVVDDSGSTLMLEKDLLEAADFEGFVAVNATLGMTLARKEKPDIIIMDLQLPDMRGSEAAMMMHRDSDTRDIPIVFVTAAVMAEGMEEIKNITHRGFIGKPINTRTFAHQPEWDDIFYASQIEFINLVVDHLTEHGVLSATMSYESPFTDMAPHGPEGLFRPEQVDALIATFDQIRSMAVAA